MSKPLGYSVSLSEYLRSGELPVTQFVTGSPVFLSLQIAEEFNDGYVMNMERLCHVLNEYGLRIVADVSPRTLHMFDEPSFGSLKERLGLWALRVDFGLTMDEIADLAREMPIVLNASTTTTEEAKYLTSIGNDVYAMHNYYPRRETGLDEQYFRECNARLKACGLKVMAFIPADERKRGPLYDGLPTLERHRDSSPLQAYIEMDKDPYVDEIFISDPVLSKTQAERIERYRRDGVITLPCRLLDSYAYLYEQVFTNRMDSPRWMVRIAESRMYASANNVHVVPDHTTLRKRGCITMDNENYLRYQGEIQILKQDFASDEKVNVIGEVTDVGLLDQIERNGKFTFVKAS